MAKITTGYTFGLTPQQFMAVELIYDGKSATEAARIMFDCRKDDNEFEDDPTKVQRGAAKIRKWMKDPKCIECYRALVRELARECIGPSIRKLKKQIEDENGWLSNKASNDLLNKFYATVMGEDDREVHVVVEGMPKLGEPDDNDPV